MDTGKQGMHKQLLAEFTRKAFHLLIALVPFLAERNRSNTVLLLMIGVLIYTCAESLRFLGFSTPFVSSVTAAVSRRREHGRFVLGPVTLGLGALFPLLLFPPPVAALAVYVLAFADSASTLIGKFLGRFRPSFLCGKSIEGSLTCFTITVLICFFIFRDWPTALAVGLASTLVDALPLREFDNLLLPLAVGFTALGLTALGFQYFQ
jgi:dolichol kinase